MRCAHRYTTVHNPIPNADHNSRSSRPPGKPPVGRSGIGSIGYEKPPGYRNPQMVSRNPGSIAWAGIVMYWTVVCLCAQRIPGTKTDLTRHPSPPQVPWSNGGLGVCVRVCNITKDPETQDSPQRSESPGAQTRLLGSETHGGRTRCSSTAPLREPGQRTQRLV